MNGDKHTERRNVRGKHSERLYVERVAIAHLAV